MKRPATRMWLAVLALAAAAAFTAAPAGAAIEPPWCGDPEPDAAENLPDGTSPTHPAGSFPHIPVYAIGCTLERIVAESDGRMTLEIAGYSELGRPMYVVVVNAVDTEQQRKDFQTWEQVRKVALTDPARAQELLRRAGDDVKIPIYIQGAIHGNEYEGTDAIMAVLEDLATTPYGEDPRVDEVLDHAILLFNVIQNPDGRVAGTRANANGFDLNRDFLTQAQSETRASVTIMQDWLPTTGLDLHGYTNPLLAGAATKPHNPGLDYDLILKWNQPRLDANEDALNADNFRIQRPMNDWCPSGSLPGSSGLCAGGIPPGPGVALGWDDWGPFYTVTYMEFTGIDASTVEMCNQTGTGCGVAGSTTHTRGRLGSKEQHEIVMWSTFAFDVANRQPKMIDQLEVFRRGVTGADRPECCDPYEDQNWMTDYPTAYVIPLGAAQRSDAEANRLVEWLLFNGVEVDQLKQPASYGGQTFERGSYVVWTNQALRGIALTGLGIGDDISDRITQVYAPPAAWSHGYLWGAEVVTVPYGEPFVAQTNRVKKPSFLEGRGVEPGRAERYALTLDSPAAVRAANSLLEGGVAAELGTEPAGPLPAGAIYFPADPATKNALDQAGKARGLTLRRVSAPDLPPLEPVERSPRIAVLTGSVDQQTWSLRNLGFDANPVSVATINSSLEDPLAEYDLIFNTGTYPSTANATARARIEAFFARGGGYLGAGSNSGTFLQTGGQVTGYAAATRSGNGRSGIVNWVNSGGAESPIVGTYPAEDTAITDPPTWFTSVPATLAVDGRLPTTDILAAGFWVTSDAQSVTAPGAAVIAHGENTAGTARVTLFAMNPLYRADPERMWPAIGTAAFWAQQ